MSDRIQAVRGMNDVLPQETPAWQFLEDNARRVLESYGYEQIRFPLLERTALFSGAIGESTDVVSKEMYTFEDRNGESLSLRPEGTAGCVRALLQHGMLQGQTHRLWYQGPMFRHERPQKGRLRQFHQIGAEAFGLDGPDVDAELILLGERLWRRLGLTGISLEINTLGTPESRARYRDALVEFFSSRRGELDEDSRRRLESNPLRILDSKNPDMRALIDHAPRIDEHLDAESADHFGRFKELLDAAGVGYRVNPRLVRGLDYYTRTVFEWLTDKLGAQSAICAGGRYDGLVASQGGPDTPGVGFAMGLERIIELLRLEQGGFDSTPHAYLLLLGETAQVAGTALAEKLRDALPALRLVMNAGGGSMKAQFRRADRSGAQYALILGEAEAQSGEVAVKPLRGEGEQQTVSSEALPAWLAERLELGAG